MALIDGQYRLTVYELRELLDGEPDDAVVIVGGEVNGEYAHVSIYKTATAADNSIVYLCPGDTWPEKT